MSKTALIPLVDGFEEIEAITTIDILRRAEIEVVVAGVKTLNVTGSHAIHLTCDALLEDAKDRVFDVLALPGGPGTPNLGKSGALRKIIRNHIAQNRWVAAICAAPSILAGMGVLEGRNATCYPCFTKKMLGAKILEEPVVVDAPFITSQGAGTTTLFALSIVECLLGNETSEKLGQNICLPGTLQTMK